MTIDRKDDLDPGDEVTVTFAPEKYAPIQFHSFDLGPFIARTKVRPDETGEEALIRAYKVLEAFARKTYPQKRDEHLWRYLDAEKAALKGRK